ncbi:alpha/beta hydrolase [Vallitalea pronyensis]|uniref:Alpha/beta hydrolase n=1 Tax=Vallitalea pronyensis TaxID=1348613 RepID=A0A8J8MLK9_9FIRM|nr:alpha/beta hydrolase [Vallitalea pronyensis]QUI24092.1 alpha/beta hydrolase [Vallitalea pronyensis]
MAMNLRKYGEKPYKIAVIHGGPGAAGAMKPVAEELAKLYGVLEPLQTAKSVEGQIQELKDIIEAHGEGPMILIGHSWGAMLIYMLAAQYAHLADKIIMVASGAVEEKYYPDLCQTREERLSESEREELTSLRNKFSNQGKEDNMDVIFGRFGALMEKLDAYDPMEMDHDDHTCCYEIFAKVWPEAHRLRKSGAMYEMGKDIQCEVVAIHGDYDSHPIEGIRDSLHKVIKNFTCHELKNCGHTPWYEKQAKDAFYQILLNEITL